MYDLLSGVGVGGSESSESIWESRYRLAFSMVSSSMGSSGVVCPSGDCSSLPSLGLGVRSPVVWLGESITMVYGSVS